MSCGNARSDFGQVTRPWGKGWRRYFFPGFWLVYLGQPIQAVGRYSHGVAAIAGYVLIAAFAVCYLVALPLGWSGFGRAFWWLYAVTFGLTVLVSFFAHQDGLVLCVYLAVLTVATRRRWGILMVAVLVAATGLAPRLVPSWGGHVDWNGALTVFLVSFAMFGFFMIIQSNVALTAARSEVARLAAENERTRIARDLHDLLGHSLTTITVKAGLARRLAERGEDARALAEITEVEQLSRRTLGDVRAAVSAHHEVTLPGELATAREVLRAAGIIAELPASIAETDPALSELFGWVVREGITNVVRHSRAQHVHITIGRDNIEIFDDGKGGFGTTGNGLRGLRERVEAMGGTVTATGGLSGFRLRADVPEDPDLPTGEAAPETPARETQPAT